MCGIVGIHSLSQDNLKNLVEQLNKSQEHRGPDGEGFYFDLNNCFSLAMKRLAIVDIVGGEQPKYEENGRFVIVFNGEILNAPQLRKELEAVGEVFSSSHSDTEVLLKLYKNLGISCLKKLNGMFTFAIYDKKKETVVLVRDRLGIKPLYYTQMDNRFIFASELKSILSLSVLKRNINKQSLYHFLSLMYVPGSNSILNGIKKLKAGHYLVYKLTDRKLSVNCWWNLTFKPNLNIPKKEWPELIRTKLSEAVNRWMLSDVPVGCSLSGGLDSSALVGLLAQSGKSISTYSLGFKGGNESDWDELPLALEVSKKWGTKHHELILTPDDLLKDLSKMVWHMDEPYAGGLPSWSVFKRMSEDVKVGITGTGGDELFGNYGKWRGLERKLFFQPKITNENFKKNYFDRFYYFADAAKRKIFTSLGTEIENTSDFLYRYYLNTNGSSIRDKCAMVDINTQLTDEFLTMTDRFSMAHSIELRPPFLDNEFVDLITTIPSKFRTKKGDLKGLLRHAVSPVLPESLIKAPKRGFVIPLKIWLRNELLPLVKFLLEPKRLSDQGIFQADLYSRLFQPYLDGKHDDTAKIWALVMFQIWHMQFIEGEPGAGPISLNSFIDRKIS
ncbi:asparagine synthase (glutamine-hydrolyzing) [Alphaproteobacteria bacterium]|nr:asparagine synthase (glutamine-hydrolyzing) [Alphaproteobacteria bacterium]